MAAGDLTNHEIIVGKKRMVFYRWNSVEIEQKDRVFRKRSKRRKLSAGGSNRY
jgi:hypothetical protein